MDRDVLFNTNFLRMLEGAGIRPVQIPSSAPNCSAHWERFNGPFKGEAADRVIFFFGEAHPRRVVDEYLVYYHRERNHQGLDGRTIDAEKDVG